MPRTAPEARLEDGTISFLAIATLESGFEALDRLGMESIMCVAHL